MSRTLKTNNFPTYRLAFILALIFSLLSVSSVLAALYTINTNNNSGSDWSGVPVFQTDPSGDLSGSCAGGDGTDDIIETYVATGPEGASPVEWIYFRIRTASASAVSSSDHWVSAYVDCPPYGKDTKDLNVIYIPSTDQVIMGDGDWPDPTNTRDYGTPPNIQSERPADTLDTLEWSADFATFRGNPSYGTPRDPNCTADINPAYVSFTVYKVTSGVYECTYDETPFAGIDLPTDVTLTNLSTQIGTGPLVYFLVAGIMLFLALVAGAVGLVKSGRKS